MDKGKAIYMSDKKRRCVAILIAALLLLLTCVVLAYIYVIFLVRLTQEQCVDASADANFDVVENYIEELQENSEKNITKAADDIRNDIYEAYPDLDELKKELDSGDFSSLSDICYDRLRFNYLNDVRNEWNSIFVGMNKYIIFDYNYYYSIKNGKNIDNNKSLWSTYSSKDFNAIPTKEAIKKIRTFPDDKPIIIEPMKSNDRSHKYLQEITLYGLREIYKNEGLEGLKNYVLLTPAYVDESSDMFGNEEISAGIHHDTYRIILVQRCNIYDQITKNYPEIEKLTIGDEVIKNEAIMKNLHMIGIALFVGYIFALVQACYIFNEFITNSGAPDEKKE